MTEERESKSAKGRKRKKKGGVGNEIEARKKDAEEMRRYRYQAANLNWL